MQKSTLSTRSTRSALASSCLNCSRAVWRHQRLRRRLQRSRKPKLRLRREKSSDQAKSCAKGDMRDSKRPLQRLDCMQDRTEPLHFSAYFSEVRARWQRQPDFEAQSSLCWYQKMEGVVCPMKKYRRLWSWKHVVGNTMRTVTEPTIQLYTPTDRDIS